MAKRVRPDEWHPVRSIDQIILKLMAFDTDLCESSGIAHAATRAFVRQSSYSFDRQFTTHTDESGVRHSGKFIQGAVTLKSLDLIEIRIDGPDVAAKTNIDCTTDGHSGVS